MVAKIQLHGSFYSQPVLHNHVHGRGLSGGQQSTHSAPTARSAVQLLPVCGVLES